MHCVLAGMVTQAVTVVQQLKIVQITAATKVIVMKVQELALVIIIIPELTALYCQYLV